MLIFLYFSHTCVYGQDSILVFMRDCDVLTIHGKAEVQCLWGSFNCQGHIMREKAKHRIYSPDTTSFVTISVNSTELYSDKTFLPDHNLNKDMLHRRFIHTLGPSLAVVSLKFFTCPSTKFFSKITGSFFHTVHYSSNRGGFP